MFRLMLFAGVGGFVGTCCRYLLQRGCALFWSGTFPLGTLIINILGCLIFGLLFGLLERYKVVPPAMNVLLITGFCGGFTTFSTFAADLLSLSDRSQLASGLLYLSASVILGVLALLLGKSLIRMF